MTTAKKPTKKIPSKKKKGSSKEIQKPLTKEEVRERLGRVNFYEAHPDSIYQKIGEMLGNKEKNTPWTKEEEDYINKHVRSIDNFSKSHVGLAETQEDGELRTTVVELANNLIEEYTCNTTLEKTLCEVIAENYGKLMQISKKFTNVMITGEYLSDERTRYLAMLSKEKEKTHRAYIHSLQSLIEMKSPKPTIHIRTQTAYMAQNQQINSNQSNDVENNKA